MVKKVCPCNQLCSNYLISVISNSWLWSCSLAFSGHRSLTSLTLSPAQHLSVSVVPSNVYSVVSIFIQRGCYCCRKVEAGRASPSLRSSLLTANDSESSIRGSSSLWCAKTIPLSSWPACLSAGFCHLGDSSDCRDSFNILRVRVSHQTQISSLCLKVRDVEKSLDVVVPFQILKVPFHCWLMGRLKKIKRAE